MHSPRQLLQSGVGRLSLFDCTGLKLEPFWTKFADEPTARLIQIVDILLVAYVAYRLLILVRGSRAWRILIGIFIYVAAWFVSGQLGLKTLHFILDRALVLGPVALVILLLPELRQALEGIGKIGFLQDLGGRERTRAKTIEEIVAGVAELSAGHTGALIVIERTRRLTDVESTGYQLDALVSAPALNQIFFNKSPFHDGAAILRGDRIVAVACQLPLTEQRLPTHMHLRHRAAVGVTEHSDAIVIVVSEERGTISVAMDGRIRESISPADLRELLRDALKSPSPAIRKLFGQSKKSDEEIPV
jgi:diadenylate cyclase